MLFAAAFATFASEQPSAEDAEGEPAEQSQDGGRRRGMFDRTIGVIDRLVA
jgi:hypothetical protein